MNRFASPGAWVAPMLFIALISSAALGRSESKTGVARRRVIASDLTTLALYRYAPAASTDGRPAVLLVPELGFSREVFDFQGRGLAQFLQARGLDTFVIELRGQGASAAPIGWHLSEIIRHDLPSAIEAVRSAHPGSVDLIAHGYGGSLALAATAVDLRRAVRRVVAIATPVAPELPNALAEELLSQGALTRHFPNPRAGPDFEVLFTRGGHFFDGVTAALRKTVRDPGKVASDELLEWMRRGDLPLGDGTTIAKRIAQMTAPTLLLLPMQDNFARPKFAAPLRELAKGAQVRVCELSQLNHDAEDYTHLSVLQGIAAEQDVFKRIVDFLEGPR